MSFAELPSATTQLPPTELRQCKPDLDPDLLRPPFETHVSADLLGYTNGSWTLEGRDVLAGYVVNGPDSKDFIYILPDEGHVGIQSDSLELQGLPPSLHPRQLSHGPFKIDAQSQTTYCFVFNPAPASPEK